MHSGDICFHCGQLIQQRDEREFAGWRMERSTLSAWHDGHSVHLPRAEFLVLFTLISSPDAPVTSETLMSAIGNSKSRGDVIKIYISYLRAKFKALDCDASIRAERGVGYRIVKGAEEKLSSRVRSAARAAPSLDVIMHEGMAGAPPFREILRPWGSVFIDEADAHLIDGFILGCSGLDGSKIVSVTSRAGGPKVRKALGAHIMRPPEGMMVDHINGDQLDNRRANLRICLKSQNQKNRTKTTGCSSRYKGVSWNEQTQNWKSSICSDGQRYHLGSFDAEVEAALAYDNAARRLHGEFAALNFPNNGERSGLTRGDASILSEAAA